MTDPTTTNPVLTRYQEIVTMIGPGFHPDTPGHDYTSLPDGITPQDVDDAIADAHEAGIDVYQAAAEALAL